MAEDQSPHSSRKQLNLQAVIFAAVLLLPGLAPSLFGWLTVLLATPVFCLFILNGQTGGGIVVRNAALFAIAASILLKLVPSVLFALTLMPLGYSFSRSYEHKASEIQAGLHGTVVLAVTWLIYWLGYAVVLDVNPYVQLLQVLDTGLIHLHEFYAGNSELPAENLLRLQQAINDARRIVPLLLPAMLCCTVLVTVGINLIVSARVMEKLRPEAETWKRFDQWKLPDQIIWVFIGAGIMMLFSPGNLTQLAVAVFFAAALLYFFQGLAVFAYWLVKWNVPGYLRILMYAVMILQSLGMLILTMLGLADVWFDFRQKHGIDKTNDN